MSTATAPRLLLVTGSGRSGTSTVTGALEALGLHVPQPVIPPDATNPRGFFESVWPLRLHQREMERLGVTIADTAPRTRARVDRRGRDDALVAEVADWLRAEAAGAPALVVKDPRLSWFLGLWGHAAAQADVGLCCLTMLRHPAEVVRSHLTYYRTGEPDGTTARPEAVARTAGWVNAVTTNERASRAHPRVFVPYPDLVGDWRTTLRRVRDTLGLALDPALDGDARHPVDDFVDPSLRRVQSGWDDLEVPAHLVALAEAVWDAHATLVADPASVPATTALDEATEAYRVLHNDALAVTRSARRQQRRRAVEEAVRDVDGPDAEAVELAQGSE